MLFLLLHLVLLVFQWWHVIVTVIAVLITTDLVYKTVSNCSVYYKTPNIFLYYYSYSNSSNINSWRIPNFKRQVRSGFWSLIPPETLDALDDVPPPLGPHFFLHLRFSWKIWKNIWKNMEKPWENHGKVWKTMGKHGKIWKNMGKHGKVWDIACDIAH